MCYVHDFTFDTLVTEIVSHPVSVTTVIALENVTLICSASVDNVKYSWHRVDGHIPHHSQGRHSDTFTIVEVTPHDEGMYYCTAKENEIKVNSNSALIQVDGKKHIVIYGEVSRVRCILNIPI